LTRIKHRDREGNIIPLRQAHAAKVSGETVREFAKRMNTALAFNASTQRSSKTGARTPNGVQIVDGTIVQDLPTNVYTLGVKRDKKLVAYPPGTRARDMLKDGAVQALTAFIP